MDDNQDPSLTVPTDGHPSFFCFTVLAVKDGDSQRIQNKFGSTLETDSVLPKILFRLDGVPLESVAQLSPNDVACEEPRLLLLRFITPRVKLPQHPKEHDRAGRKRDSDFRFVSHYGRDSPGVSSHGSGSPLWSKRVPAPIGCPWRGASHVRIGAFAAKAAREGRWRSFPREYDCQPPPAADDSGTNRMVPFSSMGAPYLTRAPHQPGCKDLNSLIPPGGAIRLVKGAYQEPPQAAFSRNRAE